MLQVLLEVEADQGMANEPGSLMDRVMVGLITSCREFRLFLQFTIIIMPN